MPCKKPKANISHILYEGAGAFHNACALSKKAFAPEPARKPFYSVKLFPATENVDYAFFIKSGFRQSLLPVWKDPAF